jgi:tRNA modification GTPase
MVVIAGAPNAGKSSLLNALAGTDAAIVTEIPGTTRDLLHAEIQIDGLPIRLVDTAGLRVAHDPVEQEGIRRAHVTLAQADHVLLVLDDTETASPCVVLDQIFRDCTLPEAPITLIQNKADLSGRPIAVSRSEEGFFAISCSALTGAGLDLVRDQLKSAAGYLGPEAGEFLARRRHIDAIERALDRLANARKAFRERAWNELIAEDLRDAQNALGEITGAVTADDLLGRIFSDFCIGK